MTISKEQQDFDFIESLNKQLSTEPSIEDIALKLNYEPSALMELSSDIPVDDEPAWQEGYTTGDGKLDFGRALYDNLLTGIKFPYRVTADVKRTLGLSSETSEEVEDKLRAKTRSTTETLTAPIGLFDEETRQDVLRQFSTEEGVVPPYDSLGGAAGDITSFIATTAGGYSALSKVNQLGDIGKLILSEQFAEQALKKHGEYENLFNIVDDLAGENVASDVTRFFAGNADDPELVQRLKLVGQTVVPTAFVSLFGNIYKKAVSKYDTSFSDLTPEQRGQFFVDELLEAREEMNLRNEPIEASTVDEVPEEVQRVIDQGSSFFQRTMNRLFSSRGFFTKKGYDAYNIAQFNKKELIGQAHSIHKRLKGTLDNIVNDVDRDKILEASQKVLTETDVSRNSQDIAAKFNIPLATAEELVNARLLIDKLTLQITDLPSINPKVKEILLENVGSYLRRSYELFENNNYVPTPVVIQDAHDYFVKHFKKLNKKLTDDEAYAKAQDAIDTILSKGDKKSTYEWINNVKKVNRNILKKKNEDLAPEIRALMGEIEDPADNIVATISKMATFIENSKFYSKLEGLGNGKYIFDPEDATRNREIFNVKIPEGATNSSLDGKYTTQEMLDAILDNQSSFLDKSKTGDFGTNFYRNFLYLKGLIQKNKTVYSHVTHARNFTGAMQFGLANGINPFGRNVESFKILKSVLGEGTDKERAEAYGRYQRLGIINTSAKQGEIDALIDQGVDTYLAKKTNEIFEKFPNIDVAAKKAEDLYMATDDLFKMNAFETELAYLKRAYPDESLELLETQAARIIRDTFPNYDRVTPLIKSLKDAPIGNFVSFPAEILRTSYHIIHRGAKEALSSNPVIRERGLKRLAGYGTTTAGWGAAAKGSEMLLGLSEEEAQAIDVASETPWSKSAPRIKMIMNDWQGKQKLVAMDTQYVNSYSTVQEPFLEVIGAIQRGEVTNADLDTILKEAVSRSLFNLFEPYADPAILTATISEATSAMFAEDGRSFSGKPLFPPNVSPEEKVFDSVVYFAKAVVPGSMTSLIDLAQTTMGHENWSTGKVKNLKAEIAKNMTGFGFRNIDPDDKITSAFRTYNFESKKYRNPSLQKKQTVAGIARNYETNLQKTFKLQQELYRQVTSVDPLITLFERPDMPGSISPREEPLRDSMEINALSTTQLLKENSTSNFSKGNIDRLMAARFSPQKPVSLNNLIEARENNKIRFKEGENLNTLATRLNKIYNRYYFKPLDEEIPVLEERFSKKFRSFFERDARYKGGVVDVPNAPAEPDERIDKMTGLPYNEVAGPAFQDNEDEADPLRRLGFVGGGRVKYSNGGRGVSGLLNAAMRKVADVAYDFDAEDRALNEQQAAIINNKAIEKGLINEREKIKLNEDGTIVEGQKFGDSFNAINHSLLTAKNPQQFAELQLKERVQQITDGVTPNMIDYYNNIVGKEIADKGNTTISEIEKALFEGLKKRQEKLVNNQSLIRGDFIFNAKEMQELVNNQLRTE